MFKDVEAVKVVGYGPLKVQRKGNAWWTDEMKNILQRSVAEEIRMRRTSKS